MDYKIMRMASGYTLATFINIFIFIPQPFNHFMDNS